MPWQPWDDYPRTGPRAAKGGIKAQTTRGRFGASWWGKRWIEVLESFQVGGRLQRGRSYARKGQVLDIEVGKGLVRARVQGSRPRPYSVSVKVRQLTAAEWRKASDELGRHALFAARLLAGEMPADIEQAFERAGVSLFPQRLKDLDTDCSCPDYSNPCKHIAAVYYLLGEEFDRDPFLIFRLRGLAREELVGLLGEPGPVAGTGAVEAGEQPEPPRRGRGKRRKGVRRGAGEGAEAPAQPEPLPADAVDVPVGADPARFWGNPETWATVRLDASQPPVSATIVKQLGPFPFWRGEAPIAEALEPLYRAASRYAADVIAPGVTSPIDRQELPRAEE